MAIGIGMHTDNLHSLSGSFEAGVELGAKFHMPHIEFGVMGYDPSVSPRDNPLRIRRFVEDKGMFVSQIDGAYPMMGPEVPRTAGRQSGSQKNWARRSSTRPTAQPSRTVFPRIEVFNMAVFN